MSDDQRRPVGAHRRQRGL